MATRDQNPEVGAQEIGAPGGAPAAEALDRALAGALYPLGRRELVLVARENEAEEALLTALSGLFEQTFTSGAQVEAALARRA